MTSALILDCDVVGAFVPPRGSASFDRGDVVVRHPGGLLRVREVAGAYVRGTSIDEYDWLALLASEQAVEVRGVLPVAEPLRGLALWIFRDSLLSLADELHLSPHAHLRAHLPDGAVGLLVDEPALAPLRETWLADHVEAAQINAQARDWEEMLENGRCALALAHGLDPEVLALCIVACERSGRAERARGLAQMALRSGDVLAERLSDARARLDREVDAPRAQIWWKRTRACADVRCACGAMGHVDVESPHFVKCGGCGVVYRMGETVSLTKVGAEEARRAEEIGALVTAVIDKR